MLSRELNDGDVTRQLRRCSRVSEGRPNINVSDAAREWPLGDYLDPNVDNPRQLRFRIDAPPAVGRQQCSLSLLMSEHHCDAKARSAKTAIAITEV